MNHSTSSIVPPWYRQFWPWFVMALPASVVIASLCTLAIAIREADEVVRDDYYKDGLAINQQLDRERLARTMNLQAQLTWKPNTGEIRIHLPTPMNDQKLLLRWLHPLKQQFDREMVLTRSADTPMEGALFSGRVDAPLEGRFYIQLENVTKDASTAWRLHGEISAPDPTIAATITLIP